MLLLRPEEYNNHSVIMKFSGLVFVDRRCWEAQVILLPEKGSLAAIGIGPPHETGGLHGTTLLLCRNHR